MGILQQVRFLLATLIVVSLFVTLPLHPQKPGGLQLPSTFRHPVKPDAGNTGVATNGRSEGGKDDAMPVPAGDAAPPSSAYPNDIVPFEWKPMTDQEAKGLFAKTGSPMLPAAVAALQQTATELPFSSEQPYLNPYRPLNRSSRPCGGGLYTKGRWVRDESLRHVERYPSTGEILGCCQRGQDAANEKHGGASIREELLYRWETSECDLHAWDEALFCKALRGRDVMIAGDSLNDHWHASLYYLLGGRKDIYKKEGTVQGKKACKTHPICAAYYPKPLKLYFLTNQLLEEERRLNRNYKWWKHISRYPILILNAGSWMRDPGNEERLVSDQEYFRHMRKALAIVKSLYSGTVIWRTTYQGHPYCWKYTAPLTAPLRNEDFPRVPPYLRYRWWAIPHRNNYTVRLWREAGAHILDVAPMTNLMPLGHLGRNHPKFSVRNVTDCLHYCSPGPVYDSWSMLLMNLLAGNLDDG